MSSDEAKALEAKLEEVIKLLQDLFILEAAKFGMNNDAIRKQLGVRMARVSDIAKHLE
jgi:hypothetical protein